MHVYLEIMNSIGISTFREEDAATLTIDSLIITMPDITISDIDLCFLITLNQCNVSNYEVSVGPEVSMLILKSKFTHICMCPV